VLGVVKERVLVALVAILVAGLLSVFAGVRIVGEPMNALAQHARTIGSGELDRRLDLETEDELGELAREMNRMAERLRDARTQADALTRAKLRAMEQLRHADRLSTVGTLASGMAHELGTPLGVIGGRAKMIAADEATREESVQYAHVISGQVDRMTKIMRGLLDFARRSPAKKSKTNVREVAARIVDLLTPLAKRQGATIKLADGAAVFADADPTQLEQAIANLVVNGVQSMPDGGEVEIEVSECRASPRDTIGERSYVCVAVRDHGKGICKEDLPHVFEPFFTTKEVGAGTGLGLSVTYGIIEDHGGFIDVESQPDRGTCFRIHLPVAS
jgi:two-component system NtrC family sensor kinase